MCGIVAVTGYKKALPLLLNGLEKLEYRGYDSAGIAIINSETKNITCNKTEGKLKNLIDDLNNKNIPGTVGIGHTRWACLLYTSPSPRDISGSRMPSSA